MMARMARGVRRYSSGSVARYGGGFLSSSSSPGFSLSARDSAACCRISLLMEVSDWALVVATRIPVPVVAAPVRSVPMDGMTAVVPADWSDIRKIRVALLYTMDW